MAGQATVIRWEDPMPSQGGPLAGSRRSRYNRVADELRGRPGRWGVVAEFPAGKRTSLALHIRCGAIACFGPAGDFDAVARQVCGVTAIYARYCGDGHA